MNLLRSLSGVLLAAVLAACAPAPTSAATAPVGGYTVVKAYPHDTNAFTEGLLYRDGFIFESTGLKLSLIHI